MLLPQFFWMKLMPFSVKEEQLKNMRPVDDARLSC